MKQLLGQSTVAGIERAEELGGPHGSPSSGPEQAVFRLAVRRSLEHHGRLARTVALGGAALAVFYVLVQVLVFKTWPVYQANSIVYVNPTPAKVMESQPGTELRWPYDSNTYETYIQQQMMNVSRDDVLADAVHRIPGFAKPGESDQAAAQRLVRRLVVTREPAAYEFSIGVRDINPNRAAEMANAMTAAYMESTQRDEHSGDAQRLTMLREERDRIEKALNADHAEQDQLNRQLGEAAAGGTLPNHYDQDIAAVHQELVKARTEHDEAESKSDALQAGRGPSSAAIDAQADEMVATDAGLVSMKQSLNARRAALISQMANLTPANPQYKQDELELTKINGTLDAMLKDLRAKAAARIQLQLRSDLQRTAGVESQLNGQLRQLVEAAGGAAPKLQRAGDLAADLTRLQARFATVDEQLHNLMLTDNAPLAAYQAMAAVAPLHRTKSGVLRNAFLLVLAGLFFGVLAAVVAQRMDPHVYIAEDVEAVLGYQPMAQLPDFTEVSAAVAEEYLLRLASALEHARNHDSLSNCVFTGAGPGAGVTTLVNRVRAILEAMGRHTVLVDATGASASAPPAADAGNETGLVPVSRLSRPTALLQQMAEETGEKRLVLTDTAPLTISAETEYLARFVDCAIVVVNSGTTTRVQLRDTARMLERLGVSTVGFVLNRVGLAQADPAFRNAVEAVERHLAAQVSSGTRRTSQRIDTSSHDLHTADVRGAEGSQPDGRQADRAPKPAPWTEAPKTEFPRSMFEPGVAAAAAAVARFAAHPSRDPEVCHTSPVVAAPAGEAARRFSAPIAETMAVAGADAAGAANDVQLPRATAQHAPAINGPVAPETAKAESPMAEPAIHNPARVEPVGDLSPIREAIAAPAVPVSMPAAPQEAAPESDVPWWLSMAPHGPAQPQRPAVIWEPARIGSSRTEGSVPMAPLSAEKKTEPVPAAATWVPVAEVSRPVESGPAPAADEAQENMTSRLSGLRSLLYVLGVKEEELERTGTGNRGMDRQKFERAVSTAEVLPPRPVVINIDKLDETAGQSATRQDRRASFDGIELLPSKRGQYKKL